MEFSPKFFPTRLNQHGAIRKDDRWNAVNTVIELCDECRGLLIAFNPNLKIRDMVGFKKCLGAQAVRTDLGCVHHNLGRSEAIEVDHKNIMTDFERS